MWVQWVLRRTLVGFARYTIYKLHIKDQNRVIQMKDLPIFEDYKTKKFIKLLDYSENKTTFQRFFHIDNDNKDQELPIPWVGQKIINAKKEEPLGFRA